MSARQEAQVPHDAAHGADLPRVFEGEGRAALDATLAKYPTKQAALLPALWLVQQKHGWVSPQGMAEVADTAIGNPEAMASRSRSPNPSHKEGKTKTVARR